MAQRNMPIVHLEEGWAIMQEGIDKLTKILQDEGEASFTAEEYMNQYTTIYNMCTQRAPHEYSAQLYDRYTNAFNTYLRDRVLKKVEAQESGPHLLKELQTAWDNHAVMVRWLTRFFNYLDRYYVQRHNLPKLEMVALMAFRDELYQKVHVRAKDALLEQVRQERAEEQSNPQLMKKVIEIFIAVSANQHDTYRTDFESYLLEDVHKHYEAKAREWIASDSCAEYLKKAEAAIDAEAARADSYLHTDSKKPVLQATREELLIRVQSDLIQKDSGCSAMLRDNKTEDLKRMFELYSACGPKQIEPIADIFRKHIEAEGMSLVKQATDAVNGGGEGSSGSGGSGGANRKETQAAEQQFIRKVIELQDKYTAVVKGCFQAHSSMHKALKDAAEAFCNKTVANTSTAELLANFCDALLRKAEKMSEEETEGLLHKAHDLLVYITDRDIFGEWHRKRLAKRLLAANNVDTMEESFLTKLKSRCGAQFTQKMEGMCIDLKTAQQKQTEFQTWQEKPDNDKLETDLDVKVLTTGFWPSYAAPNMVLPQEMEKCVGVFQKFYGETTKNRKLNWMHSLGTVHVKAQFRKEAKELVLVPYQAAILALFNDAGELSIGDMMERTNLEEADVVRSVSSMAHAKHHILKRKEVLDADGKKVKKSKPGKADVYSVNLDFTDKLRRLKVPMPVPENKKKVVEEVQKDRNHAIDAAIVRIMKSRKALEHQQLVPQVLQQLMRTFQADNKAVKKRVEDLIEREYLKRDDDNNNLYRYMA